MPGVNLAVADRAFDRNGQLFFDIFDTDGFIGDVVTVNSAYAPFFEVLPRKYRFRLVNASMARFYKFVLVDPGRNPVQLQIIANDGNLLVNPVTVRELDYIGSGERFDFVVDFSTYRVGDRLQLVNVLEQVDGRLAKGPVSLAKALAGISSEPAVGSTLEFRVVGKVASVDIPGLALSAADRDWSLVPVQLTEQIPIVTPVRERIIEWARGGGGGPCIPDCGTAESFPWVIKINGEAAHTLNANRISALIPRPNEVEHWTFVNGGGGWDHPVHLHFEEAVTIDRGGADMFPGERLARKDVWRLRPGGKVKVQVNFSDFGGAYVAHCHNTAHEDFAMLMRFDVLTDKPGEPQAKITATPNPTPDGVFFTTPEILPEAFPTNSKLVKK